MGLQSFDVEYRIVTRDKRLKYIREKGYAVKNEDGKIIALFGTAQDITDYRIKGNGTGLKLKIV